MAYRKACRQLLCDDLISRVASRVRPYLTEGRHA